MAEIAEVFSSNEPDTCTMADVDRGKIFCIDVPQDYTTCLLYTSRRG